MADSDIQTAVARALEDSPDRNFTETVDLAINLRDLDLNEPSNRVDESIVLPSGTGQETRIVVIAEGETAVRAEEAADEVLGRRRGRSGRRRSQGHGRRDGLLHRRRVDDARHRPAPGYHSRSPREDAGPARARRRRRRNRQPTQKYRAASLRRPTNVPHARRRRRYGYGRYRRQHRRHPAPTARRPREGAPEH